MVTSNESEIEYDISQFFRQIDGQLPEEKKKTLKLLIDKYTHVSTSTFLMDKSDFLQITSGAIRLYVDRSFPKKVKNTLIGSQKGEAANLCLIESAIEYLESRDCLKKKAIFDYKK